MGFTCAYSRGRTEWVKSNCILGKQEVMRPGSKDLKSFPEPATDDNELKSLASALCLLHAV